MAIFEQLPLFGKTCRKCGQLRPIERFAKSRHSHDGREHICRACRTPNKPPPIHTLQGDVDGKVCRECSRWKPIAEYHREKQISDGRKSRCADCSNAKTKRYRDADPTKWNAGLRASYYRHAEQRKADVRRYRQVNAARISAAARLRYPGRYLAAKHRYLIYAHTRRARKHQSEGQFTPAEWRALQTQYDNRCLRCGRTDVKLTPDHIVPLSVGGSNAIQNIQPLCLPCNRWKAAKTIDFRPAG